MADKPVLSNAEGHTRRLIGPWDLIVVLILVATLAAGFALPGTTDADESGAHDLRPLPTPSSTVTATAGWWGEVVFPTPALSDVEGATSTLTTTAVMEAP